MRELRGNCFTQFTMPVIALGSIAAYSACFWQFQRDNSAGYGMWIAANSIGIAVSLLTMCSCYTCCGEIAKQRELEAEMSWRQYLPYLAKQMINPLNDNRRFFAFGTSISNWLMLGGEALEMHDFLTARFVLEPLYYLAQFTALTIPVKSENAYLIWGATKGLFQLISLGVSAQEPEKYEPIIAANIIFLGTAIAAISSGIMTKYMNRETTAEYARV